MPGKMRQSLPMTAGVGTLLATQLAGQSLSRHRRLLSSILPMRWAQCRRRAVSVTGSVTAPGGPTNAVDAQPRSAAAPAAASDRAAAPLVPPAPAVTTPAPTAKTLETAPPIGFTLHYDDDLHRLILESRDPITGFVIYQMPPKYVVKQFTATVTPSLPENRGASVDEAV